MDTPSTPEGAVGSAKSSNSEKNPFLMSEADSEAAFQAREAEEKRQADRHQDYRDRGEPIPPEKEGIPIDPDTMTKGGKVAAMRRSGMTDDQISAEFARMDAQKGGEKADQ